MDASGVGISAVLSQDQNGCEDVIACASHTLQSAELNYSTVEQEALACEWGAEKLLLLLFIIIYYLAIGMASQVRKTYEARHMKFERFL